MRPETALCEATSDRHGNGRLPDTALAHHHDHAMSRFGEFSDKRIKVLNLWRLGEPSNAVVRFGPSLGERSQCVNAGEVACH